jgi:hypothetical protein
MEGEGLPQCQALQRKNQKMARSPNQAKRVQGRRLSTTIQFQSQAIR